jgi:glycosyltransferase involved in cell wall biosynthesis
MSECRAAPESAKLWAMPAKKVLHVTESEQWSGGSAQILRLIEGLKDHGWESAIACRPGGEFAKQAAARGFRLIPLALRQDYDALSAWTLSGILKEEGFSVMHAHHSRAHGVCLMAKAFMCLRGAKAPAFAISRRVSFAVGKNPFSAWKYRSGLIDRYVAVAEAVKVVLVKSGVPPERVTVIHSGADLEKFAPKAENPAVRKSLGIPASAPLIGKIANAAPWKGQTIFLEAAKRVLEKKPDVRFVLVGRGTQDDWVKAQVARLGLDGSVTLAGFREDVPDVLACLSVSVNAAIGGEGLSGALRESLCMGVPVVASDFAGNRELLGEEGKRFLVTAGDSAAMAERLLWALDHQDEARKYARGQRARLENEFSSAQNVRRTAALYDELAKML